MKLISVEIYGNDFRGLTANTKYSFNISEREDRLSTKCFAGLNGSGKSNMLELLSEIFYFLEYYHLESANDAKRLGSGFGFEIQYLLYFPSELELEYDLPFKLEKNWCHIRIRKSLDSEDYGSVLEVSIKPKEADDLAYRNVSTYTKFFLPKKIIAYTSGQNELLSNPFNKLKFHYLNEFKKNGEKQMNDRLFLIDNTNNYSIFVANLILGEESKRKKLEKAFKIKGLRSFRITINLHDPSGKFILFAEQLNSQIEKLKLCASFWAIRPYYGSRKRQQLIMDFCLTDNESNAVRKSFKFHFDDNPFSLFQAFYQLDMMNLNLHQDKIHKLVERSKKDFNISQEIPQPNVDELVFRIENIQLLKTEATEFDREVLIRYKHLSDGEHQFSEVIGTMMLMEEEGCLMLFDEPDTHFNPKWRASIIRLFNEMAAISWDEKNNRITKVRNQEVIITTHSPFAISDSDKEDVYIFTKNPETGFSEIKHPDIPTYGTSIQTILEHVFNRDSSISDIAYSELELLKSSSKTLKQIATAKDQLFKFGESLEKFDAISILFEKEHELNKKKLRK